MEKEKGSPVNLNYFSLAQAVLRFNKKHPGIYKTSMPDVALKNLAFKDAFELRDHQLSPGSFNRNKVDASNSKDAKIESK